jgi:hypothetical protein
LAKDHPSGQDCRTINDNADNERNTNPTWRPECCNLSRPDEVRSLECGVFSTPSGLALARLTSAHLAYSMPNTSNSRGRFRLVEPEDPGIRQRQLLSLSRSNDQEFARNDVIHHDTQSGELLHWRIGDSRSVGSLARNSAVSVTRMMDPLEGNAVQFVRAALDGKNTAMSVLVAWWIFTMRNLCWAASVIGN